MAGKIKYRGKNKNHFGEFYHLLFLDTDVFRGISTCGSTFMIEYTGADCAWWCAWTSNPSGRHDECLWWVRFPHAPANNRKGFGNYLKLTIFLSAVNLQTNCKRMQILPLPRLQWGEFFFLALKRALSKTCATRCFPLVVTSVYKSAVIPRVLCRSRSEMSFRSTPSSCRIVACECLRS